MHGPLNVKITKLRVAFRNFANGPENWIWKGDISGSRLGWSECRERHLAVWQTGQVKHERNKCDDDDDNDGNDDIYEDKNRKVLSQLTWSGVKQFVKHWNKNNLEVQLLCLCVPHTAILANSSVYF